MLIIVFCLGIISEKFDKNESGEASLKRDMYGFLIDHNPINKSDILNFHKYLMVKNNIK